MFLKLSMFQKLNTIPPWVCNQLGHECSKVIIMMKKKVHFLYALNLPAKLPGYGLVVRVAQQKDIMIVFSTNITSSTEN